MILCEYDEEQHIKKEREISGIDSLWSALTALSGHSFQTAKGLTYTVTVRGGELFVDRKEKSITKATVELAYRKAMELEGHVTGPKKLGVFGASYLYPVFIALGVITNTEK